MDPQRKLEDALESAEGGPAVIQLYRPAVVVACVAGVLVISACGGGGTPTPQPSSNSAPTANAGQAQTVLKGALVTLDGSASADPDGDHLAYRWTQIAGTAVALDDPAAARPGFTAPRTGGTLTFSLVVGDGRAKSAAASVSVTVRDQAPVAVVLTQDTTESGLIVTLDGRASSDPDGDALSYFWHQTSGPLVALNDWHDGTATFQAPLVSATTALGFSLLVTDVELGSVATATVFVSPPGAILPPTATAGPDLTAGRRSSITLYGTGFDVQGRALTLTWMQTAGPSVALAQGSYPWNASWATFTTPEAECDLTFRLTVDNGLATATDDIVVQVRNLAPVVAASLSPSAPTTVDDLTAVVDAHDPDGDALTLAYTWKRNGAVVVGATAAVLPRSETTRGDVIAVVVTASDGQLSTTVEMAVTIEDSPPVLSASAPTHATHGQLVSFQVMASDPDGDPVGDLALEYGPAGMQVSPGGLVTWTAGGPMFDRAQDFNWSVVAKDQPAARLAGTITVEDAQRQYPLRRTGMGVPGSHAGLQVTDLDGDGRAEMLVASIDGVYELARSGSGYAQRWMYPFSPGGETVNAVAAADVDGDGKQEIFFAAGSVIVELGGVDRREVARYDSGGAGCVDLALADLDRDGALELVCLASSSIYSGGTGQVVVLDARALTVKWSTPQLALGGSLAVGNVDADPALEIVTAGGYVFDGATQLNEWAYGPGFGAIVDVGDLDGDGVAEIVGMQSWSTFRGYSALFKSPIWEVQRFNPGALRVADIDGDGKAEVIVGDAQWGSVTAYRYDPATASLSVVLDIGGSEYDAVRAIGVGDVDGDGDGAREIVFGAGGLDPGAQAIVIAGTSAPATVEWSNPSPQLLDRPFSGGWPARTAVQGPAALMYAVASTNGGYDGTRLIALDPATGLFQVSSEVGSNWNRRAALDVADYDHDGIDEALLTTSDLYDGYFVAYDFARDAAEWTSAVGIGAGSAVTHADLNGDGYDDLVAVVSANYDSYVYAFDVKNQALIWKSTSLGGGAVDVAVADVDGDGALEIVALSTSRAVVYRRVPGPVVYVESATFAVSGALDLLVADCDGDGTPEIYVLSNGYWSGPSTVTRLDGALQPMGSFALDAPAQSLHLEDLGFGRKNLLVGIGDAYYTYYTATVRPHLRAVDARTGAEVWRSPPLWGSVSVNSLSYVDLNGGGERQIAFATAGGMYVTR